MSAPISAVLFDLDGLLIDSEALGFRVWQSICAEQDLVLTEALYRMGVGAGVEHFMKTLEATFDGRFRRELARERRPHIWESFLKKGDLKKKPGFEEILGLLEEKRIRRAIATSTERRLVEQRFVSAAINPLRFQAIVCGDEVGLVKPAPDLYLRAAELIEAPPAECLVLEDSATGAEAASRAQMRVVVVPDLLEPSEATKAIAVRIEPNLYEVCSWLLTQELVSSI